MIRAVTLLPVLLAAAALTLGCGAEPSAPTLVTTPDVGNGASPAEEAPPSEAVPDGVPKIASDAAIHEFGAIKATDSIDHVFKIRNAGTADLKIERVQRT